MVVMTRMICFLALLSTASSAAADSQVNVAVVDSVGRPMDGTVTLTGQPGVRSCRTVAARCTLMAPPGTYSATLAPVRESAPPATTVVVGGGGVAQIVLRSLASGGSTPPPSGSQGGNSPPPPTASTGSQVNCAVVDSIGRPMDGTVTLTGQPGTRSCRTVAGRCTLNAPPGTYSATLAPVREGPPPPTSVVVGSGGVAQIVLRSVAAPPPPPPGPRPMIVAPTAGGQPPPTNTGPAGVRVSPTAPAARQPTIRITPR